MDQSSRRSAPPRTDEVISEERFQRYHAYAREHGVNRLLYLLARAILTPAFLIWLRLSRTGREHLRGIKGGLIVASNHRSFLDPFVIGVTLPWRRPMQYVAKVELFERRWQGWILSRVGAFPIRRGQSDDTAMETARLVLERGGTVCIFPEGTRIRSGSLATPEEGRRPSGAGDGRRGGPVRGHGSEQVRRGWRIRPRKVKLRVGAPDDLPPHRASVSGAGRHRHRPDLAEHRAPVGVARRPAAASKGRGHRRRKLGDGGGGVAGPRRARGPARNSLGREGGRDRRQARERPLPARDRACPKAIAVKRAADIELAGVDLVCLAVPSAALPAAVGSLGDRIGSRAAVLLLTKGLTHPLGQLPSEYVGERIRCPRDRFARRARPRTRGRRRDGGPGARVQRRRPSRPARARCSTEPGSSASEATTWSASRWREPPRTPPRSARRPRRDTA